MLRKLVLKPGFTSESTSYANEGTFYEGDKVRFRYGHPEQIGGWAPFSGETFLGVCRSLFNWESLISENLLGVGTHLKFYVNLGGAYYDITPIRKTSTLTNALATVSGEARIYVTDVNNGSKTNDSVIVSGIVSAINGIPASEINGEHFVTVLTDNTYYFTTTTTATASGAPASSSTVQYELNSGSPIYSPSNGWGSGAWSRGSWGSGAEGDIGEAIRLWSQTNYGQDLIFNPRGLGIYYWTKDTNTFARAINIRDLPDSVYGPTAALYTLNTDNGFLLAMGTPPYPLDTTDIDPLLIRWPNYESLTDWDESTPDINSQAGSLRLTHGSRIISAMQSPREVLVWTDTSLYSVQYTNADTVWVPNVIADNISIISPQAMVTANNLVFWMGVDKFYVYSGRVDTLVCSVLKHVFQDINLQQQSQVFCGTNEGFNEIWWHYCSADSIVPNRYVIYNYVEQLWYFGSLIRSAWLDSPLLSYPLASSCQMEEESYVNYLIYHEYGSSDQTTSPGQSVKIESYIQSADFSIEDGDKLGFIWRIVPDITFKSSEAQNPSVTMTVQTRTYPGAAYTPNATDPTVTRTSTVPVEQYTNVAYIRARGRQIALRVESAAAGTAWQLGSPRVDMRTDGRR
jgi:hypothetical protein